MRWWWWWCGGGGKAEGQRKSREAVPGLALKTPPRGDLEGQGTKHEANPLLLGKGKDT